MPSTPTPPALARPFSGVLLDMDGTLIDSIASVERSWLAWCREYDVDPARLAGFHGVSGENVIAGLLPEEARAEAFARIREIEVADVAGIEVLPGAAELLALLAGTGVPCAIVTSSTHELAEARLRATGLRHPDVVVTASDVERGKPWPDPWLLGARRLGREPADCLVVEDAATGLQAARAADCGGLVAVTTTMTRAELEPFADLVVPDLSALHVRVESGGVRVSPRAA